MTRTHSLHISIVLFILAAGCAPQDPESVLAQAEASFEAGDISTASILVQNLLQDDGSLVPARILLGRIALAAGEPEMAATNLEIAQGLGASGADFSVLLAEAYVQTNRAPTALATLDAVAESDRDADFWVTRARADLFTGNPSDAAQALAEARRLAGETTPVLLEEARLALAEQNRRVALERLAQILETDPDNAEALAMRGALEAADGRLEEARADFVAAASSYSSAGIRSRAGSTLLPLVQVQLALNEIADATQTAQRISELLPNSAFADYAGGLVAFQGGDFERTVQLMRLALTKAPDQPQFLALLGAAHLAVGNFGQAEQQFVSILARNPSDPAAVRLLAETRIRQQRPRAALDALADLQASDFEKDAGLLLLQGAALLQDGSPDEAIPFLEQASGLNPADQNVLLQLARAYAEAGRASDAYDVIQSSQALTLNEAYTANVLVLLDRLQNDGEAAARAYVDQLTSLRPDDPGAHMLAYISLMLANDIVAARAQLERALALDADFVPAHLAMGALAAADGRAAEAEEHLQTVIRIQPDNVAAAMSLAQLAMQRSDFDAAEGYLRDAADRSNDAATRLALARLYITRGDASAAQAEIDRAAAQNPESEDLLYTRGMAALAAGDAAQAVELLDRARAAMPNRPSVALMLAQAQAATGADDAARDTLAAATAEMPSVAELRIGLGAAELRVGNTAEALAIARQLEADFSRRAAGYALEGQVRMTLRHYDDAAAAFRLALERDRSWTNVASLAAAMRLGSNAGGEVDLIRGWLQDMPGDVVARLFLADLYSGQSRLAEALTEYDRVIELDPRNVAALNNAAWFAHELGRDTALDYARQALDAAPENAAVLDTLGWILTEQNQAADALSYLERATQSAPQSLEIRYHLAVAQVRAGRVTAARETLRALLSDARPFEQREAARALLESI